jgi:DNA-binding CsgD family transcriptional regulator
MAISELTKIETEIFLLLAQEPMLTNVEIAEKRKKSKNSGVGSREQGISPHTVASHVHKILDKLELPSRYLIQTRAIKEGLYCPNPKCACVKENANNKNTGRK